jgi:hypothetical protein
MNRKALVDQELARREAVRAVLLSIWDPVGVGSNIHLKDEYDGYLSSIVASAGSDDPTHQKIWERLLVIETELGMFCEPMGRRMAAEAIGRLLRPTE